MDRTTIARFSLASVMLSLCCLLVLHFVSPEFDPAWRMVSEYALGSFPWLLLAFFLLWGASSLLLAFLVWGEVSSGWARFGVVLVAVSGVGAIMGGLFDVSHPLHGLAAALGVPTVPVAALLVSYHLAKKEHWIGQRTRLVISAHATWISFVLLVVSMVILITGFQKAGFAMGPDAKPPETLPDSVIGVNGYFNRLLVLCNQYWLISVAVAYLRTAIAHKQTASNQIPR